MFAAKLDYRLPTHVPLHGNRVHEELSRMGYSWHWRLDDDSLLTSDIGYDVFRMMKQNNKVYGFVNTVMDGLSCVKGLWENADKFLR